MSGISPDSRSSSRSRPPELVPTVQDFLATVTPWISVVGIIVLSSGGTPEAVGIGLIAGGILSTRALTSNRSVAQR